MIRGTGEIYEASVVDTACSSACCNKPSVDHSLLVPGLRHSKRLEERIR
jgi:hypothetical protein